MLQNVAVIIIFGGEDNINRIACMKTNYVTTSTPILAVHTKKETIWDMQRDHLGDKSNLFQ